MPNTIYDKDVTSVLADIVSAVVGQFDMEVLLNQIINSTMDILHAEVCSIFLEDRENEPGTLKCVAGSGFAQEIVNKAKYRIGEGFTGSVAKFGGEYNIQSRDQLENLEISGKKIWKGKFDNLQWETGQSEFRNLIALPLKIKNQTLGVIKAENKLTSHGNFFSDEDLINFKTIANAIALTIENARLVKKIEEQSRTIYAVLPEVASAVVGHFDMQTLLDEIINTIMKTLRAEVCSIFLEDKEKEPGIITCVAGTGFAEKIVGQKYKSGEGLTGSIFKYGEGYNSRNLEEHKNIVIKGRKIWRGKFDKVQWPSGENEFRNGIGLPLKIKDRILGVIKVENKIKSYGDFFSSEDFTIFQTIANVIALTIENARFHQKAEEQWKKITDTLAEVGRSVVGHFDMESLLDQIIGTTMKTLNAEVCSIFLEDREQEPGILKCVAGSGHAEKIVGKSKYKSGEGLTGAIFKYGEGYNSKSRSDLENLVIGGRKVWQGKFDRLQWPSGKSEFRNGIGLPLRIKDQILGVIKVENKIESYGAYFTEDDLRTFKTIANVIALAIENARLHDKIERQLKAISAKAAHRINNQAANYDGIQLDLEEELDQPICDKDNIGRIRDRLVDTTSNLKKMIGELKNYGKPIKLDKRPFSINKIIKDEAWYAKPPNEIKIDVFLDETIPNILIDGRFAESVKELIKNAMTAILNSSRSEGEIRISTEMKQVLAHKHVLVRVEDSGPGFPHNFAIFEPFNSTDPQSTGLGLATVKELVEKHGGEINAYSSILGGAAVEFKIPIIK